MKLEDLEFKLIQIASFLIDETFTNCNEQTRNKYKNFSLRLTEKVYASRLGLYKPKTKEIEVSSVNKLYFSDIIITFIHEIAHHIEFCTNKTTSHGPKFYKYNTDMLKKAIDIGLLKYNDVIFDTTSNARNAAKVAKKVQNYIRSNNSKDISFFVDLRFINDYNKRLIPVNEVVKVKCNKKDKDVFKTKCYTWNEDEGVWYKKFTYLPDYNKEVSFLNNIGYLLLELKKVSYFTKEVFIVISGNTYKYKDLFKENNFRFDGKVWKKKVLLKDARKECKPFSKAYGVVIDYNFI